MSAGISFSVPATAERRVRQMVEATNARAALHGLTGYQMSVTAPFLSDYTDPFSGGVIGQRPTVTVQLTGAVPRHQGWTVLARLDHEEEGEMIISLFPGLSDEQAAAANGYRAVANLCHGCRAARHRTATYLVRHDSGEFRQLGSTCVEPYTGLPIKGLLALWRIQAIKDSDWDEKDGGVPADLRVPVAEVLRVAAAVVAADGRYYSRADEWRRVMPTAHAVEDYFFNAKAPQEWKAALDADPDARTTGEAIRAWAAQGYGDDDAYRHKIGQLARVETVSPRHLSVLVSAIAGWRRDQERAEAECAAEQSTAQGIIGQRHTVPATVTAVIPLEDRHYGYRVQSRNLIKFQDVNGNVFVWFSSAAKLPARGDQVEVTGTVKEHGSHSGTVQTVLTRCRISQPQPVAA
ncbi:hypothetical protein [Streptacidiphilus sp. MAP5-3]|uniref:hypothetical protein n=1 Tax=unclassified Streptacidiphilus TaxID=2643834 RepID=UPI003512D53E